MPKKKIITEKLIVDETQLNEGESSKSRKSNCLRIKYEDLKQIFPLTESQKKFFHYYDTGVKVIALHGVAGSGKTFITLFKSLQDVLSKTTQYQKIIIIRSAVQTRDIGHLPGNIQEKTEIYENVYKEICSVLFDKKDSYNRLVEQGYLEFMITSFIRGITLDNSIVIVDEFSNMDLHELDTIITRIGKDSRIIFCGDIRQTDLRFKNEKTGVKEFLKIVDHMNSGKIVEFNIDDIVRSNLVREYIISKSWLEDTGQI